MLDHIWKYQRELLGVSKDLPPSYHKLPNQDFDLKKSEVTMWLIEQPEILSFLFEVIKKSEMIVYDKNTKKWCGTNWEGEQKCQTDLSVVKN